MYFELPAVKSSLWWQTRLRGSQSSRSIRAKWVTAALQLLNRSIRMSVGQEPVSLFVYQAETKQRGKNCNPQYCVYPSISYCGSSPCSKVHRRSESTSPSTLLTTLPVVPKCGLNRCKAVCLQVASLLWSHWEWPLIMQRPERTAALLRGLSSLGFKHRWQKKWPCRWVIICRDEVSRLQRFISKATNKGTGKNRVCLIKWH